MAATPAMKHDHNREVYERKVFPFGPSRPGSPAASRASTARLKRQVSEVSLRARPHVLTRHGIEFAGEPGPALHPGLRSRSVPLSSSGSAALRSDLAGLDRTHRGHKYHSTHEFGHHMVQNNMNPFLAHHAIPKWETTATSYGVHYKHPEQTYLRPMRNRMPVFHIGL